MFLSIIYGQKVGSKIRSFVGQAKFFTDVYTVGFHGLYGYVEKVGNLFGALAVFDKIGHFDFRSGEVHIFGG